jgi:hypothetical protein
MYNGQLLARRYWGKQSKVRNLLPRVVGTTEKLFVKIINTNSSTFTLNMVL